MKRGQRGCTAITADCQGYLIRARCSCGWAGEWHKTDQHWRGARRKARFRDPAFEAISLEYAVHVDRLRDTDRVRFNG